MPIPSSGELSLRNDIALEIGGSSTANISLRVLSSVAGFSVPDAMSEFYGYSRNRSYFETRRGQIRNIPEFHNNTYTSTMMGWFRVNSISKKNQIFFSSGRSSGRREMIRAYYIASLNRISVEWYDNGGTRRMRRQYPLHDNPNRTITGVTSSNIGWERDQRGNTDSNGFVHICIAVNLTSRSYTGIRLYWNGQELTYSVNNQSSSVNATINSGLVVVGNSADQTIGSASNFEGAIDNFLWLHGTQLNVTEIQTYYNAGNVYPPGVPTADSPPYSDANGYTVYGVQGFEGGIVNEYGWLYFGRGEWEYQGSSFSIAYY